MRLLRFRPRVMASLEEGLTVGELLLILLVVGVAIAGTVAVSLSLSRPIPPGTTAPAAESAPRP
ncbi:MAG: hypothetical protein ACOYMY_06500 [Prochlorococcaceae cyanobacterium]